MRKKFIAGNWKMFTNAKPARELAAGIVQGVGNDGRVQVAVCPPFPWLLEVAQVLRGSPVALGGQNLYPEKEGAFTGEVSPAMLLDAGCRYVILGHSERRQKLGELDAFINRKVHAALEAGLEVILCIGETLEERQTHLMQTVLTRQLAGSLAGVGVEALAKVTLSYEPVWAIGTGQNATPQQAQEAHVFVRRLLAGTWGEQAAQATTIQYGGSVKADNVASLLHQPDVDGALVGGASLKADQFLAIVRAGGERGEREKGRKGKGEKGNGVHAWPSPFLPFLPFSLSPLLSAAGDVISDGPTAAPPPASWRRGWCRPASTPPPAARRTLPGPGLRLSPDASHLASGAWRDRGGCAR
jgi:triosephosphate isomerase